MRLVLVGFIAIFLFSCGKSQNVELPKITDNGNIECSIPIRYGGVLRIESGSYANDTVPILIVFDTGAYGVATSYVMRDSLNIKDSLKVTIAGKSRVLPVTEYFNNNQLITKNNYGLLVGWDFFRDDIIEISHKQQCLNVLRDDSGLDGYEVFDYTIMSNKLAIPASIFVQGREMEVWLLVDTGYNLSVFMSGNSIEGLNEDHYKEVLVQRLYQDNIKVKSFTSDSIKVGMFALENREVVLADWGWESEGSLVGVIGNEFLKNYSVILDFRKQKLYLKEDK